ncbi:MAG: IclR family transcriptional regulator [Thermomicrobiales bacterium]
MENLGLSEVGARRSDPTSPTQVKSASRALDIVELLAASAKGVAFIDVGRALGIPKSSLHALLGVLTERGFVEYDQRNRLYSLGIRTWEVGQSYIANRDLLKNALPVMRDVVASINETVQLAVLDGIENVYLAKVDCSHPVRLQSEVGKRLYAHATGLGKVLLAGLDLEILNARFAGTTLPELTPNTAHDLHSLFQELETVRTVGFAIDDQEYTPGLRCVAVPLFDIEGRTIAALSASIPLSRAGPDELETALRAIAGGSIDISRRLGQSTPNHRLSKLINWRGDVLSILSAATTRR